MIHPDAQLAYGDAPFAVVCTDFGIVVCQTEAEFKNFCRRAALEPRDAIAADRTEREPQKGGSK